eukprot:scaffold95129_cov19-Tisochrysis_lutea.AAC.1
MQHGTSTHACTDTACTFFTEQLQIFRIQNESGRKQAHCRVDGAAGAAYMQMHKHSGELTGRLTQPPGSTHNGSVGCCSASSPSWSSGVGFLFGRREERGLGWGGGVSKELHAYRRTSHVCVSQVATAAHPLWPSW